MLPRVTGNSTPEPVPSLTSRTMTLLAQQSMGRWSMTFGVLVLGISGLFGGWTPAPPRPPATVDTVIDGGAWRVTILRARLVGDLKPMVLSNDEDHWIVVVAKVEITTEETWTHLGQILELPPVQGVEGERAAGVVLMRDARRINQLHPAMPEEVAFFWQQKAGSPVPTEITVRVGAREYRMDTLTKADAWMPNDEAEVLVRVPVVDKREAK